MSHVVLPSDLAALAVISAKQKQKVYLPVTFPDISFVHTLAVLRVWREKSSSLCWCNEPTGRGPAS